MERQGLQEKKEHCTNELLAAVLRHCINRELLSYTLCGVLQEIELVSQPLKVMYFCDSLKNAVHVIY